MTGHTDEHKYLDVSRDGAVAVVALNRPRALNALSFALLQEFFSAFAALDADGDIAVIVVTGTGDRAFSAGADIKELARLHDEGKPSPTIHFAEAFWALADSSKPTIGALNGLCYGGGALLASALDMRVGCRRTEFRFLGVAHGRINSTWLLPSIVGLPAARELLFTGSVVEASHAYRIGLLNHLVEPEDVRPAAMELALTIAGNDQRMVQGAKRLLHETHGAPWRQMFENEGRAQEGDLKGTPPKEAFADFLARRGGE